MAKSSSLDHLDRLARFDAAGAPVLSLYLNTEPDGTGRTRFDVFLRKELPERVATFPDHSPEREALDRDVARIEAFLESDLAPSTRGLAVFACDAHGLFDTMAFEVPFDSHHVVIDDHPHLYPLARLHDQYPRYAALVVDSNLARIFVFSTGVTDDTVEVENEKISQVKAGGWSQARYQRHVEHTQLMHVKEVVERLDGIVAAEGLSHLVIAGDEVIVPVVKEQLPERLSSKLVDVLRLDIRTPEHAVLEATLDALRKKDVESDQAAVEAVVGEYRAGGLGTVGVDAVTRALENGQVDTLFITADATRVRGGDEAANRLVALAAQTSAGVRFIEDAALLHPFGGAGARLRYRI